MTMNSLRCHHRLPKSITQCLRTFSTLMPRQADSKAAILGLLDALDAPPAVPQPTTSTPDRPIHASSQRNLQGTAKSDDESRNEMSLNVLREDIKRQMPRRWRSGDVYAPHDLGSVEASKWKTIQRRPEKDVFDMLGTHPIKHYKNLKMMSEFVTDTGRIKGSRETGLRPRNQRRVAKAVRRAIGIGLMPSVYIHPEIQATKLNISRHGY